jgi:hypothetical protein
MKSGSASVLEDGAMCICFMYDLGGCLSRLLWSAGAIVRIVGAYYGHSAIGLRPEPLRTRSFLYSRLCEELEVQISRKRYSNFTARGDIRLRTLKSAKSGLAALLS